MVVHWIVAPLVVIPVATIAVSVGAVTSAFGEYVSMMVQLTSEPLLKPVADEQPALIDALYPAIADADTEYGVIALIFTFRASDEPANEAGSGLPPVTVTVKFPGVELPPALLLTNTLTWIFAFWLF